jgi:hypothetical protein
MQVYEVVLKGQQFNVAETPPSEGDAIEAVINGVTVKRFVTKNTSGRCWGYAEGRQKIWINTTTKKM